MHFTQSIFFSKLILQENQTRDQAAAFNWQDDFVQAFPVQGTPWRQQLHTDMTLFKSQMRRPRNDTAVTIMAG